MTNGNEDSAGGFRVAGNDAAANDAFRRMVVASMSAPTMRTFTAAAAMLIAGKRGSEMKSPEPLVQVGFEPGEAEMARIEDMAREARRDLIHVGCHDDGSGKPTGMIAVVYFEDGRARPHRRCGLLCAPGSSEVFLSGVSDEEDETCHFLLSPGRKMTRVAGYPVADLGAGMQRAGELWLKRVKSLDPASCKDEVLRIPGVLQGPGGPA